MTTTHELIGRYKITGVLGEGAMGKVYRAIEPASGNTLAIKTLQVAALGGDAALAPYERFKREGNAGSSLAHPNIVKVHEFGESDGIAYIVMDYITGESLRTLNARRGIWPVPLTLPLINQLLDAVEHFHSHDIVHRDLKPGNIIIDRQNHLTVTDFGIARLENSTLTQAGAVLGTPWYMSPEQVAEKPLDGRSDLFSVAILFYEMITGQNPFKAAKLSTVFDKITTEPHAPPSSLLAGLPLGADKFFERALAKNPANRFQTADEFRIALRQVFGSPIPQSVQTAIAQIDQKADAQQTAALAAMELSLLNHEPQEKPRRHPVIWLVAALIVTALLLLMWPSSPPVKPAAAPVKPAPAQPRIAQEPQAPTPAPSAAPATAPEPQQPSAPAADADTITPDQALVENIRRQCNSAQVARVLLPEINGIVRCEKTGICQRDTADLLAIHHRLSTLLAPESGSPADEVSRTLAEAGCSSGLSSTPGKLTR